MKIVEAAEVRQRLTMPVCHRPDARQPAGNWRPGPIPSRCAPLPCCRAERSSGLCLSLFGDCFGAKGAFGVSPERGGPNTHPTSAMLLLFEGSTAASWGWLTRRSLLRSVPARSPALPPICWPGRTPTASLSSGRERRRRSHLAAMTAVRDIHSVTVYDQNTQAARRYCQEMEKKFGVPVTAADSVREAVHDADIVCTVTPSREPYLEAGWIAPGTHINAVGAFTPTTREVTSALVARVQTVRRPGGSHAKGVRRISGPPLQEGADRSGAHCGFSGRRIAGGVSRGAEQ